MIALVAIIDSDGNSCGAKPPKQPNESLNSRASQHGKSSLRNHGHINYGGISF
jgi:hypothetical protein